MNAISSLRVTSPSQALNVEYLHPLNCLADLIVFIPIPIQRYDGWLFFSSTAHYPVHMTSHFILTNVHWITISTMGFFPSNWLSSLLRNHYEFKECRPFASLRQLNFVSAKGTWDAAKSKTSCSPPLKISSRKSCTILSIASSSFTCDSHTLVIHNTSQILTVL